MIQIPLSKNGKKNKGKHFAQIDEADLEKVSKYSWYFNDCGVNHYAFTSINNKKVPMHRMIIGNVPVGFDVDHIDGNGLNNCRNNLRVATRSQNSANAKGRGGTSKYKGVSFNSERKKWVASITFNYQQYNLGRYATEELAKQAYDAKAKELFGDFYRS